MKKSEFLQGIRHGIPICLGYFSVSAAFGITAVRSGLPLWTAVLISLTNVTSAGQFAGVNLMVAGGSMIEIAMTTLIINIRYFLMSLSVSQKVESKMSMKKRLGIAYGITDEIFAVSMQQPRKLTASYMAGLILTPVVGWTLGTFGGWCCHPADAAEIIQCHGNCFVWYVYCHYHSSGQRTKKCAVHGDFGNRSKCCLFQSSCAETSVRWLGDHFDHDSGQWNCGMVISEK